MELSELIGNGRPDIYGVLTSLCSFSAWGVTRIIFGILLVYRWSRWYALVFIGLLGIRRNSSKRSNAA